MTPEAKKLIALVMIGAFISLPEGLSARERRGAAVVVIRKDGGKVGGELIAVKPDSLLLLNSAGKDESVAIADITAVRIVKKSKAGTGFLLGALVGSVAGGLITAHSGEAASVTPAEGAVILGALTGLIGLGIGMAAGSDDTVLLEGESAKAVKRALDYLGKEARIRDSH